MLASPRVGCGTIDRHLQSRGLPYVALTCTPVHTLGLSVLFCSQVLALAHA